MNIILTEGQRLALRKHGAPILRAVNVRNPDDFEPHKLEWRELLTIRTNVLREARALIDKIKPDISEAEGASIEEAHNATMAILDEIETEKEARTALGKLEPRAVSFSPRVPMIDGSSDGGYGQGALGEARAALATFARTGDLAPLHGLAETRDMAAGSDPNGGYFVVNALSNSMTKREFDQSPMRGLARVVTLTAGDTFEEPLDMDEAEATWVGEQTDRPKTDDPEVGKISIPLKEIYALQTASQKVLDVSNQNLGGWLEEKISDKFARSEGLAFVSGNAADRPRGFLALATDTAVDITRSQAKLQHVISGGATFITADALRNLYWTLRAGHRKNATWLMSSSTANAVDKLKDGNGDYLWRNGMTSGAPPTLLNLPVEFDENMPAVAADAFPIALGDWKKGYIIVDRMGVRFLRDPYTDKPNVLFYAYKRVGGDVANTDAIKLLKIAAS